jgi:predicted xylose isomerase-like sugar epimerase
MSAARRRRLSSAAKGVCSLQEERNTGAVRPLIFFVAKLRSKADEGSGIDSRLVARELHR